MTARSLMPLGLMVLVGTALSAMGSLPPALNGAGGAPRGAAAPPAEVAPSGLHCRLSLSREGTGTAVTAQVTADDPVSGRYDLSLRAGGNVVAQDGDFAAAAGETVILGEATLPGAPEALDASLTVTAEGRRIACPREAT